MYDNHKLIITWRNVKHCLNQCMNAHITKFTCRSFFHGQAVLKHTHMQIHLNISAQQLIHYCHSQRCNAITFLRNDTIKLFMQSSSRDFISQAILSPHCSLVNWDVITGAFLSYSSRGSTDRIYSNFLSSQLILHWVFFSLSNDVCMMT